MAIDTSRGAYVTADGRSRLVLVRPTRPPFERRSRSSCSCGYKRSSARCCPPDGAPAGARDGASVSGPNRGTADGSSGGATAQAATLRVRYAGGHRIALEIEWIVRRESIWNSVGSLAVILPLLYFAFRSPWLVVVGALPSALAILIVLAGYAVSGTTLSAAATGAAAMQFGLGIDGVVLLFVAFRQLTSTGLDAEAATAGLTGSASSMLLGMWTTAATFYGLMVVDFPSLEELGRIIGHSMVLCGVLTLVLVPALLPRRPRPAAPLTTWWLSRLVERRAMGDSRRSRRSSPIGLGLAARGLQIDPSLDRLRANTSGTAFEQEVATRFGVPQDVYVVSRRARRSSRCSKPTKRSSRRPGRRGARRRDARAEWAAAVGSQRRPRPRPPCGREGSPPARSRLACATRRRSRVQARHLRSVRRAAAATAQTRASGLTYEGMASHRPRRPVGAINRAHAARVDARHLCLPALARRGRHIARQRPHRRWHDAHRHPGGES